MRGVLTAAARSLLALTLTCFNTAAFAQSLSTGTIAGKVLDSSGAVVPGVTISLKGSNGSRPFTALTDGQGAYRVANLAPDTYDVRADLSGYQPVVHQALVRQNAVTEVNFTLAQPVATEHVEVTARILAEDLQKVPQSIQADAAGDLEAKSVQRLSDLGQVTPNLLYGQKIQSGSSAGQIYIRGIGQQDTKPLFSPGVGIYVDGVYLGSAYANDLDMADVKQVEVLYGPQGTLFGKNSNGGAINIVTTKPDVAARRPVGSFEMQTGSFGQFDALGALNVPLVTGKAALQVSATHRGQDGYSLRIDGQDQANQNNTAGRVQLLVKPTDKFEVLWRVDGTTFDEHSGAYRLVAVRETSKIPQLYAQLTPYRYDNQWVTQSDYRVNGTGPNRNAGDVWGTSATITWKQSWGVIKSITAFRNQHLNVDFDPDGSPLTVLAIFNPVHQHQFSQELQAAGTSSNRRLQWVTGLYYFTEDATDIEQSVVAYEVFQGQANSSYNNFVQNRSPAAYGQATFALTDRLRLTGGGRLAVDKVDAQHEQLGYPDPVVQVPRLGHSANWTSFLPRVGLDYQWTPAVMAYVSVAEGSKSGGFNGRASSAEEFTQFEPEKVWAYEVGLRSEWFDKRLRVNGTAFYNDYKDYQIQLNRSKIDPVTGIPEPFSFVGNMPKARVTGGEFSLVTIPTAGLRLSAGLGITDGKYIEVLPGAPVTTGSQFVNAPKYTFTTSGEYSWSLRGAGRLAGRVDYIHKSTIQYDYSNSPLVAQSPYGLLNARLTWQTPDPRLSIHLFGTNLANRPYALGGLDDGPNGALGEVIKLMGPPREWGVGAQLRF